MQGEARGEGVTGAGRGRGVLLNGLLGLVSLAAFLGLAEGAARLLELRPDVGLATAPAPWLDDRWLLARRDYREGLAEAGFLARYYDLYTWDRFLFYRLRPNRQLELVDPLAAPEIQERTRWSVRTGPEGFRTGRFEPAPEPGRPRILTLGDSSTFGWGVEGFETYAARLPDALARRSGAEAEAFEVINLGVPGYSTFQGRVLLERVALPLRPDLVTWSFLSNDGAVTGADDALTYAHREGWRGALLAALHGSRAFEALEGWIALARARLRPPAPADPRDPSERNVSDRRQVERNVRRAVAQAREAALPIVLLGLCVRPPISDLLERVSVGTGATYLDGTALLDAALPRIASDPEFRSERRALARRYGREALAQQPYLLAFLPDGCHPNGVGHRLLAEALAATIAAELPEVPSG